jgi:hypothetical protein
MLRSYRCLTATSQAGTSKLAARTLLLLLLLLTGF